MHPDAEVILYGNAEGAAEVSRNLEVTHVSQIGSSASGVPLFGDIASHAATHARFDAQVYLNCDILVTDHVIWAVQSTPFLRYLMVGQRIDLSERATALIQAASGCGALDVVAQDRETTLHPVSGIDYFVFPRGLWNGLGSLVIGRAGYDAALVAFCLRQRIPVIDATFMIPALHQYHEYDHVKGGESEVFRGTDALNNRRLHDVSHSPPTIGDATWQMVGGRLVRNRARGDTLRQCENFLRYEMKLKVSSYMLRAAWRALTAFGFYRPPQVSLSDVMLRLIASERAGRTKLSGTNRDIAQ